MKKTNNQHILNRPSFIKIFLCLLLIEIVGCKKFVEINAPATKISSEAVYADNASAEAVLTGIYSELSGNGSGLAGGPTSISELQGLAADELTSYGASQIISQYYSNSLSSTSPNPPYWYEIYNEIHSANAAIEGVTNSSTLSPAVKNRLIGEAKFMRAFLHFYAVNLYGDVPLVTTSDYLVNNVLPRTPKDEVYKQIIQDLKDAQALLNTNYIDARGNTTTQKVRPNKIAATALLARVYLYTGDYNNAAIQATAVISTTGLSLNSDLSQVFLANSDESIWQLEPNSPGYNTWDATLFVLTSSPGTGQFYLSLSQQLLNSFELNDKRLANWVGVYTDPSTNQNYYYPNKYKNYTIDPSQPVTEYTMILRLAEQYLIRAEAQTYNGVGNGLQGAVNDLNTIRLRAGLPPMTVSTPADLRNAILHERQIELFTEWGNRWFDLIRTNTINSVMGSPGNVCSTKGGSWSPDWKLNPIPESEILVNHNLKQNPGY